MHHELLKELGSQVLPLLEAIKDNSLLTFRFVGLCGSGLTSQLTHYTSWNLGVSIPRAVLENISAHQRNLRCLSLMTDLGESHFLPSEQHWYNHLHPSQLRKLVWHGRSLERFSPLGAILLSSSAFLEEIDLRTNTGKDWVNLSGTIGHNPLANVLLKLTPGEKLIVFPSLRKLSLCGWGLFTATSEIVSAFNFSNLQSLRLANCGWMNQLAGTIMSSSQPLRLTTLEIIETAWFSSGMTHVWTTQILRSFQGLKNLKLLYSGGSRDLRELWESINHHKASLERFSHYEDKSSLCPEHLTGDDQPMRAVFTGLDVECLSICFKPIVELVSRISFMTASHLTRGRIEIHAPRNEFPPED